MTLPHLPPEPAEREPGEDEELPRPRTTNVIPLEQWKQGLRYRVDKSSGENRYVECFENAGLILAHDEAFAGCFVRNDLSGETELAKHLPSFPGALKAKRGAMDSYILDLTCAALGYVSDLTVSDKVAARAIEFACRQRCYNPLTAGLDALRWDGTSRVDRWLTTYLGAHHSDYVSAVGRWWLVSAMARAYTPGCQADHVLVLEGPQGAAKSSALRIIAGDRYFSDQLPDLGSKDALQHLKGMWIVELGEMDGLSKHDAARIKAFLTVRFDRYRPVWGKYNEKHPRSCVFAGTTNTGEYLKDDTGNRRFWPVPIGDIDLVALARDRDQILAEAKLIFEGGAQWWPTKELSRAISAEQEQRYQRDEWEPRIDTWLATAAAEITIGDVLAGPLNIEPGKWTRADQNRVGSVLRRLGWTKMRPQVDGVREYRWHRPG